MPLQKKITNNVINPINGELQINHEKNILYIDELTTIFNTDGTWTSDAYRHNNVEFIITDFNNYGYLIVDAGDSPRDNDSVIVLFNSCPTHEISSDTIAVMADSISFGQILSTKIDVTTYNNDPTNVNININMVGVRKDELRGWIIDSDNVEYLREVSITVDKSVTGQFKIYPKVLTDGNSGIAEPSLINDTFTAHFLKTQITKNTNSSGVFTVSDLPDNAEILTAKRTDANGIVLNYSTPSANRLKVYDNGLNPIASTQVTVEIVYIIPSTSMG